MSKIEDELSEIGLYSILGIDEVGMGCLAGPVVVGAVLLPPNHKITGIRDSKKLSAKKREELTEQIYERALYARTAFIMPGLVDSLNIRKAAMSGIVEVVSYIDTHIDIIVIDGNYIMEGDFFLPFPYMSVVKADDSSYNVGAASIIAKVARDNWMCEKAKEYPVYKWESNKGYGTAEHIEAIKKHGVCPLHRMSFTIKGVKLDELH